MKEKGYIQKKIISLTMAGVMLFSAAGCSSGSSETSQDVEFSAVPETQSKSAVSETAQGQEATDVSDFTGEFMAMADGQAMDSRPEVRWWLAGGSHTDETLTNAIEELYANGFGAVEFLAMPESSLDYSRYGWGSEEWIHDSKLIIEKCTELGMGVSLTSGTHWGNANLPTITPDDGAASKTLSSVSEIVEAGKTREGALNNYDKAPEDVKVQELVAVLAARSLEEKKEEEPAENEEEKGGAGGGSGGPGMQAVDPVKLDFESVIDLTGDVVEEGDGKYSLSWTAQEDGNYELITYWMHGTAATSEPSVSTNYCVNYIDPYGFEEVMEYWAENILTDDLTETIKKNGRVQLYMDSLELGANGSTRLLWGYTFLDEFKKRRGYDLIPYLPFVTSEYEAEEDYAETVGKLKNDLDQTYTELYSDNVLTPLGDWLHGIGMTLRAEPSYCTGFLEVGEPATKLDGIETESLEFRTQIDSFRNFSGVADLYGIQLSSETGAENSGNYNFPFNRLTQVVYRQFASGISRTVFHGYSTLAGSEGDTKWPGHEGMYKSIMDRLDSRQPASLHYKDWTSMLTRMQTILKEGQPQVDLGILRTDYSLNISFMGMPDSNDEMYDNKGLYWDDMTIQNAGYTYDYVSPELLTDTENVTSDGTFVNPDGVAYKALIVYQDQLPLESAKTLLEWAKKGLPILFVNNVTEASASRTPVSSIAASVSTYKDGKEEELAGVIAEIKELTNVRELDSSAEAYEALKELGVTPRAEYSESNNKIFTRMRKTDDAVYTYVYNVMDVSYAEPDKGYAGQTVRLAVEGEGKPYQYDAWTNSLTEIGKYTVSDGRTTVDVSLEPGEATFIVLDTSGAETLHATQSDADIVVREGKLYVQAQESGSYSVELSDGSEKTVDVTVPENIDLPVWNLTVEDWNEGDRKEVTEDRGLGYETKEVYYDTVKTPIEVGETELIPWKDMAAVGEDVSGVGTYTTTLAIPEDWSKEQVVMLDLGSTNGGTAAVYVNDIKAEAVDFDHPVVDITELVKPGENTVKVEITTSLRNRMLSRGYYEDVDQMFGYSPELVKPDEYGMVGDVKVVVYTLAALE